MTHIDLQIEEIEDLLFKNILLSFHLALFFRVSGLLSGKYKLFFFLSVSLLNCGHLALVESFHFKNPFTSVKMLKRSNMKEEIGKREMIRLNG